MPNKNTFKIKPIGKFVKEELIGCEMVVDPFARSAKAAHITNDLNPEFDTDHNIDALEFLKMFEDSSVDGVIYDPPYSLRQLKECYDSIGSAINQHQSRRFYADIKDEIARITMPGAKVLSFGWASTGIGKTRGFGITRILLVPHGGPHHDTICVSDTKKGAALFV
jgi:hypothetical protein